MSNFKDIKKRLSLSTTMPAGTGQSGGAASFLTGGHLHSHTHSHGADHVHGAGCGCHGPADDGDEE